MMTELEGARIGTCEALHHALLDVLKDTRVRTTFDDAHKTAALLHSRGFEIRALVSERGVEGKDGTDRLCEVVYQRLAEPHDYLGGSQARMLHDAATEIQRLREELKCEQAIKSALSENVDKLIVERQRLRGQLTDLKRRVRIMERLINEVKAIRGHSSERFIWNNFNALLAELEE
jgi:hypothetical protein